MPAIVATQSRHFEDVAARSKRALEVADVREGPGRVNGSVGNQDFQFLRGPQGRHPRGHRFVIALVSWGYDLPEPRAAYSVGAVNPTE